MLYAFAILALPATVKLPPLQGLGNNPVDFITEGEITAVVDRTVMVTDLEKLSEADLLAVVLRHDQVISELFALLFGAEPAMALQSSLLPLRLGTAFGSESALRQVLHDASAIDSAPNLVPPNLSPSRLLKHQLQAVMGCGELLLKVTLIPPAVNAVNGDGTAPNLKGKAYLLAKKAQYEQTQQWQKQIEAESAQLLSQLKHLAHAAPLVLNPHPPENLRWCVLLQWDRLPPLQGLLAQWQAEHPHWQITLGSFGAAYHSIARLAEAATTGNIR